MIRVDSLRKNYGDKEAVKGISFAIPPGEIFVLLGPNGAGKTTTIRVLAGLLRPTSGAAAIGGHDVISDGVAARSLLAYIPDEPHLYDRLTAREFLHFTASLHGLRRAEAAKRVAELSERLGFTGYMDELCGGYSHGMRQRVVIAAALVPGPRAMVIDEPMVGLDPGGARMVKDLLRELASQGVAILMSTHTLPLAEELAGRIAIMRKGELAAMGSTEEIRRLAGGEARNGLEDVFLQITEEDGCDPT